MFPRFRGRSLKNRRCRKMGDKKQTFIDPKTGEEIEASWAIAKTDQAICEIIYFTLLEIPMAVIGGMSIGLLGLCFGVDYFLQGTIAGLCVGVFPGRRVIIATRRQLFNPAKELLFLSSVAQWQHNRRQQLLKRKLLEEEWAGVPATALTLVDRSTSPQVTDTSVSRSEPPEEEKERLTEAVEEGESLAEQKGSAI